MQTITTIGLDIAKSVFQVHGVDAEEGVADAGHPASRGANGRTCGLVLCRCSLGGRPRERALTRSLCDLTRFAKWARVRRVSSGV